MTKWSTKYKSIRKTKQNRSCPKSNISWEVGHVLKVTLVGCETKHEISCIPLFIDPRSNFKKIKGVHSPRLYLIENISCAYSILIFVIAKRT